MNLLLRLESALGKNQIKAGVLLAKLTTLGVGGPADYFYEAKTTKDLLQAAKTAKELNLPFFVLGTGSNLIVRDGGFRGLVIKNLVTDFKIESFTKPFFPPKIENRLQQLESEKYLHAGKSVSFSLTDKKALVTVGSGWKLNALIPLCLAKKIVGLEWFAGIPGTVGGAVFMNIHGGNHFFSDFVYQVCVWDETSQKEAKLMNKNLKFDYDYSLFQEKKMLITKIQLVLYKGNVEKAKEYHSKWLKQKLTVQPQRSCGSVWQNLSPEIQAKHRLPASGIGYLIDKILALKGKKIGLAQISLKHAGFIENLGGAKAKDVLELMRLVETEAKKKLGLKLKREVIVIGEGEN